MQERRNPESVNYIITLCLMASACIAVCEGFPSKLNDESSSAVYFMKATNCTCPTDILIYNCSAVGSGFTIWRGSAFDCPNIDGDSSIILRHSSFSSGTMGSCNDGAINGHSLGVSVNSLGSAIYTSQLMINLTSSSNVIGRRVECVYRDVNGVETTIGSATIQISDPPPPPTHIQLAEATPEKLIFNWTSVDSDCSSLQYNITSNCGTCADTIDGKFTSVTCSIDLSAVTGECSFGIQSVVCTSISGISSIPLNIKLKVPQSPVISNVVPVYNETGRNLVDLDIKFEEVESFMISNGVDGSAHNYTIFYTDSNTGFICDSLTISPYFSCVDEICTVPSISPLPCTSTEGMMSGGENINISILATNSLGRGPPSVVAIGHINTYVNVTYIESMNKLVCTFLGQNDETSMVSCSVVYGPYGCEQQTSMTTQLQGTSSSNTVSIDILTIQEASEYCYVVNASNGTFSVLIKGLLTISNADESQDLALITVMSMILIIPLIMCVLIVMVYVVRIRRTRYWQYSV